MVEFSQVPKTDLAEILEIYTHYILNSTATFHSGKMAQKELEEFLFVSHPKYPSFLIKDNDEMIGYCFLTQYKKRQAYDRSAELSIYLKPEFTGKGVGPVALNHLEVAAKRAGIHVLVGTLLRGKSCKYPAHGKIRLFQVLDFFYYLWEVGERHEDSITFCINSLCITNSTS